jgi:hypothetical protein
MKHRTTGTGRTRRRECRLAVGWSGRASRFRAATRRIVGPVRTRPGGLRLPGAPSRPVECSGSFQAAWCRNRSACSSYRGECARKLSLSVVMRYYQLRNVTDPPCRNRYGTAPSDVVHLLSRRSVASYAYSFEPVLHSVSHVSSSKTKNS